MFNMYSYASPCKMGCAGKNSGVILKLSRLFVGLDWGEGVRFGRQSSGATTEVVLSDSLFGAALVEETESLDMTISCSVGSESYCNSHMFN